MAAVTGLGRAEMARRMRRAAGDDPVPVHDALVRMIRRWERLGLKTERYELLYTAALSADADAGVLPLDPGPGNTRDAAGPSHGSSPTRSPGPR